MIEIPLFVLILLLVAFIGSILFILWLITIISKKKREYESYLEEKYGKQENK